MKDDDFPGHFRSADQQSNVSQTYFLRALRGHLLLLVFAAILSNVSIPSLTKYIALLQFAAFFGALSFIGYLALKRPDKDWYACRAMAESIKTITWRYICRAHPFEGEDSVAHVYFCQSISEITKSHLTRLKTHLEEPTFSAFMETMRSEPLEQRRETYLKERVENQLKWYVKKAEFNRQMSIRYFWMIVAANLVALVLSGVRMGWSEFTPWSTIIGVPLAIGASLLSWTQTKRFLELAESYTLTAHEINRISETSNKVETEEDLSIFVGDAENAFSREHTQWVARRDNLEY